MSDGRCDKSWHGVPCKNPSKHAALKFTDDDLKRLKELSYNNSDGSVLSPNELKALLVRFEAAEFVVTLLDNDPEVITYRDDQLEAIEAWRESKGL